MCMHTGDPRHTQPDGFRKFPWGQCLVLVGDYQTDEAVDMLVRAVLQYGQARYHRSGGKLDFSTLFLAQKRFQKYTLIAIG